MFIVKTRYSFKDFLALNRLMSVTYRKWSTFLFRLFSLVAGLCFTAIGTMMIATGAFSLTWLYVLIVGVLLLLLGILYNYLGALQSKRMTVQGIDDVEFIFEDESFAANCSKQVSLNPYSGIHSLFRYQQRYFICLDKRHAYIVPFSGFVSGNRDDFEIFISEKTGREWNVLNLGSKKERKLTVK